MVYIVFLLFKTLTGSVREYDKVNKNLIFSPRNNFFPYLCIYLLSSFNRPVQGE